MKRRVLFTLILAFSAVPLVAQTSILPSLESHFAQAAKEDLSGRMVSGGVLLAGGVGLSVVGLILAQSSPGLSLIGYILAGGGGALAATSTLLFFIPTQTEKSYARFHAMTEATADEVATKVTEGEGLFESAAEAAHTERIIIGAVTAGLAIASILASPDAYGVSSGGISLAGGLLSILLPSPTERELALYDRLRK